MTSLQGEYERWRRVPFPPGSSNDDLDELMADLALVDTWVAEGVIPVVEEGKPFTPAAVDVIGGIHDLQARASKFEAEMTGDEAVVARAYRDYADKMLRVYEALLNEVGSSDSPERS